MKGLEEQPQLLCPFLTLALEGNFDEGGAAGGVRIVSKQHRPRLWALYSPKTIAPA